MGNNQRIASGSQDPNAFLQRAVDAYHHLPELDKAHSASENMFRQMTESLRRLKKHEAACSKLYNMVPAHLADNVLDIISGAREVHQVFYAYYNRASEQNRIANERYNEQRRNVRGGIASALGMAYHAKTYREQMTQAQVGLVRSSRLSTCTQHGRYVTGKTAEYRGKTCGSRNSTPTT